jgi:hypothetical protein
MLIERSHLQTFAGIPAARGDGPFRNTKLRFGIRHRARAAKPGHFLRGG